jgi:hypothetical protein
MGFGQIVFLLGIIGIAGPILIHLIIRPRFKRISYTMIDFLEVSQKQSRATRRLRELLILLLRCAIVALMACIFAEPFVKLRDDATNRPEHHLIMVDNSLSMTYHDEGQSHLDKAIEKAIQYVRDHHVDAAVFDVHTFCGDSRGSKLVAAAAVDALKRITSMAHKADLTEAAAAVRTTITERDDAFVYLVSDFTPAAIEALALFQSITGLQDVDYDIITTHKPANALVKDARVLRYSEGIVELLVEVKNSGTTIQNRLMGASVKSKDVVVTSSDTAVKLEPGRSAEYVLELELNSRTIGDDFLPVEITLSPSDALAVDDRYFLGLQIEQSPQQRVLISSRTKKQSFLIRKAMEAISRAEFDDNLIIRQCQGPKFDRTRLDSSDIFICGHISENIVRDIDAIDGFLAKGGTAVFFVSRDMHLPTAHRLYTEGVIGAEPTELIDERHLLFGPWPSDSIFVSAGLDVETARAARNYTLDSLPLWSHFACRKDPETRCLWPIQSGHSLVYTVTRGAGKSLLVNTSMDDSMSSLAKRAVVVPLCRLMLGCGSVARGYGFHAEEEISLPVSVVGPDSDKTGRGVWVLDPTGNRHKNSVTGLTLVKHYPERTGWLRTLSAPIRYAGINPVVGETDLLATEQVEIDRRLAGLFGDKKRSSPSDLAMVSDDSSQPLWRLLTWIIIVLVLTETFVVNRMKK